MTIHQNFKMVLLAMGTSLAALTAVQGQEKKPASGSSKTVSPPSANRLERFGIVIPHTSFHAAHEPGEYEFHQGWGRNGGLGITYDATRLRIGTKQARVMVAAGVYKNSYAGWMPPPDDPQGQSMKHWKAAYSPFIAASVRYPLDKKGILSVRANLMLAVYGHQADVYEKISGAHSRPLYDAVTQQKIEQHNRLQMAGYGLLGPDPREGATPIGSETIPFSYGKRRTEIGQEGAFWPKPIPTLGLQAEMAGTTVAFDLLPSKHPVLMGSVEIGMKSISNSLKKITRLFGTNKKGMTASGADRPDTAPDTDLPGRPAPGHNP